jgi:hypothetical protein
MMAGSSPSQLMPVLHTLGNPETPVEIPGMMILALEVAKARFLSVPVCPGRPSAASPNHNIPFRPLRLALHLSLYR